MASPQIEELGERLGIVLRDPEAIRQAFVVAARSVRVLV